MHKTSIQLLLAGIAGTALAGATPALADDPIKIGDVFSYKSQPVFADGYKKGMQLAMDQINAAGGINGRKLVLVTRDDNGNPGEGVRQAEDLIDREKVDILTGTFLASVGTAVADFAKQKHRFVLITEALSDNIVWSQGNRYTFRLDSSTYMRVSALIDAAVALHKKRWALVYPNYEYGTSAAAAFKKLMKERQPDVEFVTEQAPTLGKIDAGSVVQAIADAKPDATFNALFAGDLAKFVREGITRNVFGPNMPVVSMLTGEPEYLEALKDEIPSNWVISGYPWYAITTPTVQTFVKEYQAKYNNENLRMGSDVGYTAIKAIAAGLKVSGGKTDTESMIKAFEGLKYDSPDGPEEFRKIDHQATWGVYVGKLVLKDGQGMMTDVTYKPGASLMPSNDYVRKLRPAD